MQFGNLEDQVETLNMTVAKLMEKFEKLDYRMNFCEANLTDNFGQTRNIQNRSIDSEHQQTSTGSALRIREQRPPLAKDVSQPKLTSNQST